MIASDLISAMRRECRLDWHGIHGVAHWARVRNIGLRLADKTGANPRVVELFAGVSIYTPPNSRPNQPYGSGQAGRS